jgi:6-phosphogluconolactonase
MKIVGASLGVLVLALSIIHSAAASGEWIVFVGTYTRPNSKGIYAYRFSSTDAKLTPLGLAVEASNPSFLAVHPNQRFLYAVNENDAGTITAYAIDTDSGKLKLLNTVPSRGSGPCHLAFDTAGKWIFVANYNNGSIAALPVSPDGILGEATGSIQHSGSGIDARRQSGPHAHSVNISADNRFLVVTDLGLDEVLVYRFNANTGSLSPNDPPFIKMAPGSGPRHFTFSPDGKSAWVLNEMNATVTSLGYDRALGRFTLGQTVSALPGDFAGTKSGAEILVHPNGKFLYTSNRGHNSIAVFTLEGGGAASSSATWVSTRGKTPRSFAIDPSGATVVAANQDSNNLAVYRVDPRSGSLSPAGDIVEAPVPASVVFVANR